ERRAGERRASEGRRARAYLVSSETRGDSITVAASRSNRDATMVLPGSHASRARGTDYAWVDRVAVKCVEEVHRCKPATYPAHGAKGLARRSGSHSSAFAERRCRPSKCSFCVGSAIFWRSAAST